MNLIEHSFHLDPTDKLRGCRNSHLALCQYAVENYVDWICVVEDNVEYAGHDTTDQTLVKLVTDLDVLRREVDLVYLCGAFYPKYGDPKPTNHVGYVDVTGMIVGAGCYVIFRPACEKMLALNSSATDGMAIDELFRDHLVTYMRLPLIFHRARTIKSTVNSHQDVVRYVWFESEFYQWCERNFGKRQFIRMLVMMLVFILTFLTISVSTGFKCMSC